MTSTSSWPRTPSRRGATLWQGAEAVAPVIDRGFVRGAVVRRREAGAPETVRARYVVVADGANSRFGRALGTFRTREWPYGTAIRGYWESPLHDEPWIESALDVKDRAGNPLPGYGWIFPVGDGTVNVGVGLLSTFRDFKSVNTTHLLHEYVATAPPYWELRPAEGCGKPTSGRLPMGGSVGPKAGPTWLVVGDAAGTVNPFNGEGIDYAYETGRIAAEVLHEALAGNDPLVLTTYERRLRGDVRAVLQGGAAVREGDRAAGAHAGADAGGDAQPHADGVGAADHGEHPAPRRAGPGGSGVQGGRRHRADDAGRLTLDEPVVRPAQNRSGHGLAPIWCHPMPRSLLGTAEVTVVHPPVMIGAWDQSYAPLPHGRPNSTVW